MAQNQNLQIEPINNVKIFKTFYVRICIEELAWKSDNNSLARQALPQNKCSIDWFELAKVTFHRREGTAHQRKNPRASTNEELDTSLRKPPFLQHNIPNLDIFPTNANAKISISIDWRYFSLTGKKLLLQILEPYPSAS
jgi:hypothetical protein